MHVKPRHFFSFLKINKLGFSYVEMCERMRFWGILFEVPRKKGIYCTNLIGFGHSVFTIEKYIIPSSNADYVLLAIPS